MADLLSGGIVGAVISVALEKLIKEAKIVLEFKPVSNELASTMKDLLPIVKDIESLQTRKELESLEVTFDKAEKLVKRCSGVKKWEVFEKSKCTKEVREIQKEMVSFCQVQLQLLQLSKQYQSAEDIKKLEDMMEDIDHNLENINKKLDRIAKITNLLREEMKNNHEVVTEKIEDFREETKNNNEILNKKVDRLVPAPTYRDLCLVPKLGNAPVGFDWPLTQLKKKLLDDSVDSLLVSGAPGCGKTKLVTQLCHDQEIKKKFTHIFFNVVSSAPNFRKLVQNVLQHNGEDPPTFDDDNQAVSGLQKLLEKLKEDGPILMVLDDVWSGAESLITNFRYKIPNYKVLVTSRSVFSDFSFTYDLKPLEDKYAKDLLIQCAPQPDEASQAEYEFYLQKILKRCNGFPLVIKVVGSSLKGKPKYVWKGQVDSWSLGEKVLDNASVLKCLEPSFIALTLRPKECFMDMGSFLEDQNIRASVIIDIRVELDGYGSSSGTVYMKYLNDLASHHLLTLIPLGRKEPEDGFYNEFLVTQHDVLRELAIRQSELETIVKRERLNLEIRENTFPNWCSNLKTPINACLLSISTDDKFSSKWVEMDCPNVEALVLNISSSYYALPNFISTMKNLKVVIIINHGLYPTRLSNLSCLSSLPNLKRIRMEKISINFLDIIPLQCSSLTKLSLVMCSFSEVFYDTEETNVFKSLPRLQEIDIDYCYDLVELPFWVSEVVSLKTLSITNCNKLSILPEAIGNLSKLEVLRLCSCICLSELPETTERLDNLRHLDISGCFQLTKLPLGFGNLQKLEKISMRNCYRCNLPDSMKNLKNLEVKCDEGTEFLWRRFKQKMKTLTITIEETEHNLNSLQF